MSTVSIGITQTAEQTFAAGTVPAGIQISIGGGVAPQLIAAAPFAATFPGVADGNYTATAQAVDTSGNPLGAAITQPFVVATPVAAAPAPTPAPVAQPVPTPVTAPAPAPAVPVTVPVAMSVVVSYP